MTPEEASWRLGGALPLQLEPGRGRYPAPLHDHALEIRTTTGPRYLVYIALAVKETQINHMWPGGLLGVPIYWWRNDDNTIEFYPTPNQPMEVYLATSAD